MRFRKTDRNDFLDIKRGLKEIETRAATEKYRKIKAGDKLVIVCGRMRLVKEVRKARRFRTLTAMLKAVNYGKIMPSAKSGREAREIFLSYTGYGEKLKKFGIMAFYLG